MSKQFFGFKESCASYEVTLQKGKYLFELWGARGGSTPHKRGGYGAYVSAILKLNSKQKFYIYVGEKGEDGSNKESRTKDSFNGGGGGGKPYTSEFVSGGAGGGATDVRLMNSSIDSRILVAAGGGGACHVYDGGHAGALESNDTFAFPNCVSKGATQTSGYDPGNGQSGRDGVNYDNGREGNGGGGGGYYGGFSSQCSRTKSNAPGAGGSSFIFGYPNSYSSSIFSIKKPYMIGGNQTMGNNENGFAIITRMGNRCTCKGANNFHKQAV